MFFGGKVWLPCLRTKLDPTKIDPMETINIHEAKTHLSRIVEQVAAGRDVLIAKAGKPMVKMVPIATGKTVIRFGVLKGTIRVPEDFDAPLPENVLANFGGG